MIMIYKLKIFLSKLLPSRKDHLHHWIWVMYIAISLVFFTEWTWWINSLIIIAIAALIEVVDKLSKKGTAEWSDFFVTSIAGLTVIALAQLRILI